MPDIFAAADVHRAALLRRERAAAAAMVDAYGLAWRAIGVRLGALTAQIAAARARGEDVSPSWLLRAERLTGLLAEVETQLRLFARFTERRIADEQLAAVRAAQGNARQLVLLGMGDPPPGVAVSFASLPTGAVTDLVGVLSDGSPLRSLLDELGPQASAEVRRVLVSGVALGESPAAIARRARVAVGGNLVRALTIARTEVLRSYREASRRTYEANRDVVAGWTWHAALTVRTCAFCWAMHGTDHRLEERMATHPRCRCAMVPRTRTWRELGYDVPEPARRIVRGADAFEDLAAAQQLKVLGPGKFAAYRDGRLDLADLVGFRRDARWGRVGFERPLREVAGGKEDAA